jgi:long-chain fatty acid transport protein
MRYVLSLALLTSGIAQAGSISAPGMLGGPDSGAATPNPAAVYFNPAAIAATEGVQVMIDGQLAFIRIDATSTRNDGIDPNTREPYTVAQARVQVPAALIGATWKPKPFIDITVNSPDGILGDALKYLVELPNRVAFGFALTDAFVGGGDYTAGEPDLEAPFESHQRYAGVVSKLITLHAIPAVGITVMDGVHIGGSYKLVLDSFYAMQASDPLHAEGVGPSDGAYESDTLLTIDASGMHTGWTVGAYVDRFSMARVGVSYTRNGVFDTAGTGSVEAPDQIGGGSPEALVTFTAPLPDVLHAWVNSDINERLTVGAGVEWQRWGACCGGPDGDIVIGVTSLDGDALGADAEDNLSVEIATTQYSPRRLIDSMNFGMNAGYQLNEATWLGARIQKNGSAVPDYAVSATNVDYANVGFMVAARRQLGAHVELGLAYSKFFLEEREITNSAWDAAASSPDYVDDRFSPSFPFKASTNGVYSGKVDVVGVRLAMTF